MWRYLIPVGLFAALVAFFYVGLGRDKETLPSPLIGKPAPQFELPRRRRSVADGVEPRFRRHTVCAECVGHVVRRLPAGARGAAADRDAAARCRSSGLNWKDDLQLAQQWLQRARQSLRGDSVRQ